MNDTFEPPVSPCYPDLRGKVALVTGGGAGIGKAISVRLGTEGMRVVLCGRTEENLIETAGEITGAGGFALPVVTDVSDEAQVDALFARMAQEGLQPDLLVHNAALVRGGALSDTNTDYWQRMLATNADSAFFLAKRLAPMMLERGSGAMVFISTIGALQSHHRMLAYDSSKGAIEAFVRSLALELAPAGIRVNSVAPGPIRRNGIPAGTPLETVRQPYVPMQRYGSSDEIAAAVAFLASSQASYITGQTLCVDGGSTAQLSPPGIFI